MWWSKDSKIGIVAALCFFLISCEDKNTKVVSKTEQASKADFSNDFPLTELKRVNVSGVSMVNSFPFGKAAKIEVISFSSSEFRRKQNKDTYNIVDGKMNLDKNIVIDKIILDRGQEEKLFSILYTYKEKDEFRGADCYRPNHRIVFYDGNKEIIAFLEVCLGCENYKLSDGFKPEEIYHTKFIQLESFFKSIGVTHFEEF